jgi:hypothetical protein
VLLDPPASLEARLLNDWQIYQNALAAVPPNATWTGLTLKRLNKTLDLCSVELGIAGHPPLRPTVVPQEDDTLKLEYSA